MRWATKFIEKEPGQVQHTASSSLLATEADLSDTIVMMARETWQVSTRAVDAIKMHPDCQEPSEAAFALINEPGVTMFAFLAQHPERARRFGGAMCCENRLRSGITSSRVVSIVVDCDYDYGNDRV